MWRSTVLGRRSGPSISVHLRRLKPFAEVLCIKASSPHNPSTWVHLKETYFNVSPVRPFTIFCSSSHFHFTPKGVLVVIPQDPALDTIVVLKTIIIMNDNECPRPWVHVCSQISIILMCSHFPLFKGDVHPKMKIRHVIFTHPQGLLSHRSWWLSRPCSYSFLFI